MKTKRIIKAMFFVPESFTINIPCPKNDVEKKLKDLVDTENSSTSDPNKQYEGELNDASFKIRIKRTTKFYHPVLICGRYTSSTNGTSIKVKIYSDSTRTTIITLLLSVIFLSMIIRLTRNQSWIELFFGMLCFAIATSLFTLHDLRESKRKFCEVFSKE